LDLQGTLVDLISFAALMQESEVILGMAGVEDKWSEFNSGHMDADLEGLGLPSPRSALGPPLAPTPSSLFDMGAKNLLSPMTEHDETFRTARADDWDSAASAYDTGQTTYVLKRIADLSDYVEALKLLDLDTAVLPIFRQFSDADANRSP
jgi:hypothetical protein